MNLIKEIGKGFFIGNCVFLTLVIILYLAGNDIGLDEALWIQYYTAIIYSTVLYLCNFIFFRAFIKNYKDKIFTLKVLSMGLVGAILISFIGIFILHFFFDVIVDGENIVDFIENENLGMYWISILISIVATIIFYIIYYYKSRQEDKVKVQKIIAGTASAKFDALKNQLDPHFLFNSLNVLTSLIEENPDQAQKFTTSLSKVYRYVLEQKSKELVTVDEELAFAKTYVRLLKMRFEDSIVFELPEEVSNPEAKVVPLSLQLLLENAVKHNIVSAEKPLHIKIEEENGYLVVKNNLQTKEVIKKSSGVGLVNITQRYSLLSKREVGIFSDEKQFCVKLPMLTKKIEFMNEPTYIHTNDTTAYERAKERVEELKGFYIHFSIYLLMIPVFIWINTQSTSFPWAIFPIVGWGFGVGGHAMEVFNYNPILGKDWEERQIKKYMDED
ncbi:histidine kinase [Gangjinia marincola]|uniref:Histidine kinase n=1 Tax=Gangjinia marincola TaxID=578463 RepID=A0ABP3XWP7_9FLAO